MVAKTRSQTKHLRAEIDRKKRVFDLIKILDFMQVLIENNMDVTPLERAEPVELCFAVSAAMIPKEDRENLYDQTQFDCFMNF